jgi:hypothetical protein
MPDNEVGGVISNEDILKDTTSYTVNSVWDMMKDVYHMFVPEVPEMKHPTYETPEDPIQPLVIGPTLEGHADAEHESPHAGQY